MRELIVEYNLENPLSGGCEAGYIGENNATKLIIRPSAELLDSGSSFFVAVFLTKGEVFRSEHFEPAENLEIPLEAHLTGDHFLSVQLEGYSEENMLVCKSPMVSKIQLLPSISGKESECIKENYLLETQIALNTESRHSHENSDVLGCIGEKDGRLAYNGKPVCSHTEEKRVVLSVDKGEIDAMMTTSGYNTLNIFTYSDIDDFVIPADAEIKSVELNFNINSLPEWIDMRDMHSFDSAHPYVLDCRKISVDDNIGFPTVCRVFFFGESNIFCTHISNMRLKYVRITYTETKETSNE